MPVNAEGHQEATAHSDEAETNRELRQRQLIRALWFTIEEMQRDGQEAGQPVPTWRIDETLGAVLSDALGETTNGPIGPE